MKINILAKLTQHEHMALAAGDGKPCPKLAKTLKMSRNVRQGRGVFSLGMSTMSCA